MMSSGKHESEISCFKDMATLGYYMNYTEGFETLI